MEEAFMAMSGNGKGHLYTFYIAESLFIWSELSTREVDKKN